MKLLGFHKLKSLSSNSTSKSKSKSKSGSRNTEHANSNLKNSKISVSQEYKAAIRTSSYEEMLSRVQIQLTRTSSNLLYSSSSSSSSSQICTVHHLSDTVLEPSAETLDNMIKTLDLHHLIFSFFKASSEACNVCELLLRNIHTTRENYSSIKRAIELSRSMNNNNTRIYSEEIRVELSTFVSLSNPLGFISSAQFHNMHDDHVRLLHRLVKKRKKISRKIKTVRICKKAGRCCLVASCGVAGAVTLVVAAHTVVGIAVAPGILFSSCALGLGFSKKPSGEVEEKEGLCNRNGEKLRMQVDAAAKWLFILVNDMDTVVSLVEKIYGEIEHSRDRVDLGLKNEVVLREVMKELDEEKMCLMEQLDELEQHIYLCLVTINKSRRSILDQTTSAAT